MIYLIKYLLEKGYYCYFCTIDGILCELFLGNLGRRKISQRIDNIQAQRDGGEKGVICTESGVSKRARISIKSQIWAKLNVYLYI